MSITFEIVKFKKPTKDDLSNLHMFNPYLWFYSNIR